MVSILNSGSIHIQIQFSCHPERSNS